MFVDRWHLLTGAVLVGSIALTACAEPILRTDLRPDGPPEVLTVMVMDDFAGGLIETATFCKVNDTKRPGLVGLPDGSTQQVCDDNLANGAGTVSTTFDPTTGTNKTTFTAGTVADAVPDSWYARIQFDELLDPNVEELVEIIDMMGQPTDTFEGHIDHTLPVMLTCGTNNTPIPYDGYYQPAGNSETWPVGPSLFIAPLDPTSVATGSTCTLTVKASAVHDKDGNEVPGAQLGPYTFAIAPLTFLGSTPAGEDDPTMPPAAGDEATQDETAPVVLTFNANIAPASLTAAEVKLEQVADCTAATGVARVAAISADADDPNSLDIVDAGAGANAFVDAKTYRLTFTDTNSVSDIAGGTGSIPGAADLTICFTAAAP